MHSRSSPIHGLLASEIVALPLTFCTTNSEKVWKFSSLICDASASTASITVVLAS